MTERLKTGLDRERVKTIIIILLVLILAGGGYWYLAGHPDEWQALLVTLNLRSPKPEGLTGSGYIEANRIHLSPELPGRVVRLAVGQGERVEKGQIVAEIEADLLRAKIEEGRAAVAIAQARVDLVDAGARPEEIAAAREAVDVAQARRDAAYQAWQDALRLANNPQQLKLQVASEIPGQIVNVYVDEGDEVTAGALLVELDATDLELRLEQLRAALANARANLADVQGPPRSEKIAAAEAEVGQAQAAESGAYAVWQETESI